MQTLTVTQWTCWTPFTTRTTSTTCTTRPTSSPEKTKTFFSCRKLKSSLKCTIAFCLGNSFWQLNFTESIAFVWGGHTMHTNQDGTLYIQYIYIYYICVLLCIYIYIYIYIIYIYMYTQVRCKLPRNLPITDPAHPLTRSNPCVELALNIGSQDNTPQNHKP